MTLAQVTVAGLLTIRLVAPEVLPDNLLTRAGNFARSTLAHAGIRVNWVRCRNCPADLQVQILDRQPSNLTRDGAGFAVIHPDAANYAALSYPRALAAAGQCGQPPYLVLGVAMAHEIGHLLLGSTHSPRGIMSARIGCEDLRRASRGELRFDPAEARRLRTEAARRYNHTR